jgi:hypothetical protein
MTFDEAMQSTELIGGDVMPAFAECGESEECATGCSSPDILL